MSAHIYIEGDADGWHEVRGMDFGDVIKAILRDCTADTMHRHAFARRCWTNGRHISGIPWVRRYIEERDDNHHIGIPWIPTYDDMLADDWYEVTEALREALRDDEPKSGKREGLSFGDVLNLMSRDAEAEGYKRYARASWPKGRYIYLHIHRDATNLPHIIAHAETGDRYPYTPNPPSMFADDWRVLR